jgi:hypothetical protein
LPPQLPFCFDYDKIRRNVMPDDLARIAAFHLAFFMAFSRSCSDTALGSLTENLMLKLMMI